MADDERLTDTIPAFRVNDEVSIVVRGIVKADRRTISDVVRALLERGVAAYRRDGKLFEPTEAGEVKESATVKVARKKLGGREPNKRRETA